MVGGVGKSVSDKTSGAIALEALRPSDWGRWRDWVRARNPPPFHTPEWLSLQSRAFHGEPMAVAIHEKGSLQDVIPIVVRALRPFWVGSSPVHVGTPYGGTSHLAIDAGLARALADLARAEGISFLDVYLDPRVAVSAPKPFEVKPQSTYVLPLGRDAERMLELVESRCRRAIRKALRLGVTVREMTVDDVPAYEAMARDTYAKQGRTPPLPIEVVETVLKDSAVRSHVLPLVAEVEGRPLAAGVFPWGGDTIYYVDGVSFRSGLRYAPNNLLHWTVIENAIGLGLARYDLVGASVDSIALFKRSFGAKLVPHSRIHWGTAAARVAYKAWAWRSRPSSKERSVA